MTIENGKAGSRDRCRKAAISINVRPPTKNIIIIGLGGRDWASDPPVKAISALPESAGNEAEDAREASRPPERSSSILFSR